MNQTHKTNPLLSCCKKGFEPPRIKASNKQEGFTFIEVVISCLIMMLLVAAVIHYHSSAGVSKNQEYYLKAVQVARAELEKLRALFEFNTTGSFAEFTSNGPPPDSIFLFKHTSPTSIELPSPLFHVYYRHHGHDDEFLRPQGDSPPYDVNAKNSVRHYHEYYEEQFNDFTIKPSDEDKKDKRTFTYYTWDTNPTDQTNSDPSNGKVDASIVVIDDMGSPEKPEDDLLGNVGWWVEDASSDGPGPKVKKITFVLQFWYPGQETSVDPEVIVLKSTAVEPELTT